MSAQENVERELRIQEERAAPADTLSGAVLDAPLSELAPEAPWTLPGDAPIRRIMTGLRNAAGGCVLAVDDAGRLRGLCTRADLLDALGRGLPWDTPLREVATPKPERVREDDRVVDVLRWMRVRGFHQVPVVDGEDVPVGVVTRAGALERLTRPFAERIETTPADPTREETPVHGP
ncbi:MAG TPA: CBS domain-containing protein [Polyangiaceae bacterium LLY-WYZ-15_(1-7)]|nr:hypothetical protein [Myxococcales bacterium]MBJ69825.1 hypothetical protein [Sandaracinus sp.]HJL02182.1 CBS domain-containing protein [Polyangiaceae bacterium LLY-WYZ-15_(1-7)]HJL13262.1 CBS domain-containing protein [Polyangiaceae bacterium LLY-WYZ-15_(1-7)]HJL25252.1 CBS domain-containing protein [Polyangiaceae bacterium LLY-WYZ-15_(1-7)]